MKASGIPIFAKVSLSLKVDSNLNLGRKTSTFCQLIWRKVTESSAGVRLFSNMPQPLIVRGRVRMEKLNSNGGERPPPKP